MSMQLQPFSYAGLTLQQTMKDLAARFVLNCPPEDISTPVRLMFQIEEANWFYLDYARVQNKNLPLLRLKGFVQSMYEQVPLLKTIFRDPNEALYEFSQYKKGIPVRGGIILNEKLDKILLVRAWKAKTWGFPRGKINKSEDDLVCAIREVLEETGFDMSPYVRREDYAEHTINGKNFLLFFASGVPETTEFITTTREEIEEIKWISLKHIRNASSAKFFVVPFFAKDIARFVAKRRGRKGERKAAPSGQESQALKEMLGIPEPNTKENVEPSHSSTNDTLGPQIPIIPNIPPYTAPSIFGVPSILPPDEPAVKEEAKDVRAKQILALLNRDSDEELEDDLGYQHEGRRPQRHIHQSRHQSTNPTMKPKLKQNSLLQVLNSPKYKKQSKLLDLLKPESSSPSPTPKRVSSGNRSENSLMKLLGTQPDKVEPTPDLKPDMPPEKIFSSSENSDTPPAPAPEILSLLGISDKPVVPAVPQELPKVSEDINEVADDTPKSMSQKSQEDPEVSKSNSARNEVVNELEDTTKTVQDTSEFPKERDSLLGLLGMVPKKTLPAGTATQHQGTSSLMSLLNGRVNQQESNSGSPIELPTERTSEPAAAEPERQQPSLLSMLSGSSKREQVEKPETNSQASEISETIGKKPKEAKKSLLSLLSS